jgi:STAM-binding protein
MAGLTRICRWGIFRLTSPPGLEHILACNQSETFHQHSITGIYKEAGPPAGHVQVYEASVDDLLVHDLRPKH